MRVDQIKNKEELYGCVLNELKEMGIKYRKQKTSKVLREKVCRMFHTHLHLLELVDVATDDGYVIQIPKLVENTCRFILKNCGVEGIFRKAGSSLRQKEIRVNLEAGLPLHEACHVIDVANVLKFFFRELPEPLIPVSMQDTLLCSLLIGDRSIEAILLSCLLLPALTLNTLSYFMKFLYTIALSVDLNKMSVENLAIIFTPSLMPFENMSSRRFANHIKVVQLLIENANSIGIIPYSIVNKIHSEILAGTPSTEITQKKKKRRSDMFNGLRKIVGSGRGSSENLINTLDKKAVCYSSHGHHQPQLYTCTPSAKSSKKRKCVDPAYAFSAKKTESKKNRISLGGNRQAKIITPTFSMERRWSIIGSAWPKQKRKTIEEAKKISQSEENMLREDMCGEQSLISNSRCRTPGYDPMDANMIFREHPTNVFADDKLEDHLNRGCDPTFEQEYGEIKNRVAELETRITEELSSIQNPKSHSSTNSCVMLNKHIEQKDLSELDRIQNKYMGMIWETDSLSLPVTEQLAQRISRGLNICRSIDQRVMRSPSARKIGRIRRRSQENVSLCRNQTWHIGSKSYNATPLPRSPSILQQNIFYGKSNLKRRRPSSLVEGHDTEAAESKLLVDQWTCGELFFNKPSQNHKYATNFTHENKIKNMERQSNCHFTPYTPTKTNQLKTNTSAVTPMLPPMSVPRMLPSSRTPNSALKVPSTTKLLVSQNALCAQANEELSGRASIARLRTQNAGMVLAKAKLFDQIGSKNDEKDNLVCRSIIASNNSEATEPVNTASEYVNSCPAKSLQRPLVFSKAPPEVASEVNDRKTKGVKGVSRQPKHIKDQIQLSLSPLPKTRYSLNAKLHRRNRCPPAEGIPHIIYNNSSRLQRNQL